MKKIGYIRNKKYKLYFYFYSSKIINIKYLKKIYKNIIINENQIIVKYFFLIYRKIYKQ